MVSAAHASISGQSRKSPTGSASRAAGMSAFLPIAVGLWAWDTGLPPIAMAAVVIGFVAWTLVAAVGLAKAFGRR